MKVTVEFNENQLAKFGITEETPKDMIQDIVDNAIATQIPYRFIVRCIENVYGDDELLWAKGSTYRTEYYSKRGFLANSETNDFDGTYMSEDDFLNCFMIEEASPEVAHAMCYEAGYADMFEHFLSETERPDFKEFYITAKENDEMFEDEDRSIRAGETYKVEYSPLSESFRIETENSFRIMSDLDFEFEVTSASREVAEYMIKESPYVNEFNNYVKEKSKSNIEK